MNTPHFSEAYIRRSLAAAKQGNDTSLRVLVKLSFTRWDVFQRALHIISHHLQVLPPRQDVHIGSISEQETLAIISIACLAVGTDRWTSHEATLDALCGFFQVSMESLSRWMDYLFSVWIYRPDDTRARIQATSYVNPAQIADSIGRLLSTISICKQFYRLLVGDPPIHVGTLLAKMVIVGVRDDDLKLLSGNASLRSKLHSDCSERGAPGFYSFLESDLCTFVDALVSRIDQYSWQDSLDYLTQLPALVCIMSDCAEVPSKTLLNAFIEQDGMIRAVTNAFHSAVNGLQPGHPRRPHRGKDDGTIDFTGVDWITHILRCSLAQAGPPLMCQAIDHGLYNILWAMRTIRDSVSEHGLRKMDREASRLVEEIIPFIVYPSVLKRTDHFVTHQTRKDVNIPSSLEKLDASLKRLISMLDCETQICRDYLRDTHRATSAYSDPYKFCDNPNCPFQGKITKLWRCTACWSGYYCSRYCQRLVWDDGHRRECKSIAASITAGKVLTFLPIHESEYLRRTLVPRFKQSQSNKPLTSRMSPFKFEVHLDLTTFPMKMNLFNRTDQDKLEHSGNPPSIRGLFVVSKRAGAGKSLTARNISLDELL